MAVNKTTTAKPAKKVGKKPAKKVGKKVTAEAPAPVQEVKKAAEKSAVAKRQEKLLITARSLRGIKRNLKLEGYGDETYVKKHGKDNHFMVFKGKATKPVKAKAVLNLDGKPVKSVRELSYGQWVTQAVKASGIKKVA